MKYSTSTSKFGFPLDDTFFPLDDTSPPPQNPFFLLRDNIPKILIMILQELFKENIHP